VRVDTDTPQSFDGLASLLGDSPSVAVTGPGTIRVDFGRENAAWFEIDSPDCPVGIRLSISEYNRPEYTNVGDKTGFPRRLGDTYRAVFNPELYEGVRFAFIHVDEVATPWRITGIRLVCQVKPVNYEGSFACSDPLLERIWHNGAYSVKLGNLKEFTTPILIERSDRVQWNGLDFSIMNTANLVAFGARDFVRKQIAATNTPPGINCGIYSFELYDVLSICEYYRYSGDASLVQECLPEATAKVERARERFTPHTESGTTGFMGWDERLGGFERVTAFNRWNYRLLCIRAWLTWADVIEGLGDAAGAERYRAWARKRIAEIRRDPHWVGKLDVHGCAEAVQAGFCTAEEIAEMTAGEFADRVNRVSYSQANTGLVVQGMAKAGLHDDALVTIEDQWGATLRYGGTTTFEMFRPSAADVLGPNDPPPNGQCGMTSLCHPWGAGVCRYLNEVVAGIVPTSPGFATVDIMPHLGRRLTSASAVTPTPHGPVSSRVDVEAGTGRVVLPAGVRGRIGIPKVERRVPPRDGNRRRFGGRGVRDLRGCHRGHVRVPGRATRSNPRPARYGHDLPGPLPRGGPAHAGQLGRHSRPRRVCPACLRRGRSGRSRPAPVGWRRRAGTWRGGGVGRGRGRRARAGARPRRPGPAYRGGGAHEGSRADVPDDDRGHRGRRGEGVHAGALLPRLGRPWPQRGGADHRSVEPETARARRGGAKLPRRGLPVLPVPRAGTPPRGHDHAAERGAVGDFLLGVVVGYRRGGPPPALQSGHS
jgi:hypothetical protein